MADEAGNSFGGITVKPLIPNPIIGGKRFFIEGRVMRYTFNSSAKKDWRELVALDPTIATYRRCTSEDMRHLAGMTGWEYMRIKRAFHLCLFQRTKYLTLSLSQEFEPKIEVRELAKRVLAKRHNKREHLKAVRESLRRNDLKKIIAPQIKKGNPCLVSKRDVLSNISRYKF